MRRGFNASAFVLVTALSSGLGIWAFTQATAAEMRPLVDVIVPDLSPAAQEGASHFADNCAKCHGTNAAGNEGAGPPLVHKIYEPNHHADISFLLAAKNGVRAHHWRFGNMPPVSGVAEDEVQAIVIYVRELQRANGID